MDNVVEITEEQFGELLENAVLETLEAYKASGEKSGLLLCSMLEKLVEDANDCVREILDQTMPH